MGTSDDRRPLDPAFDAAFTHLAGCRVAYEEHPRDLAAYRRLADARAALDDARSGMRAARARLGLDRRRVATPAVPPEGEPVRHGWQTIHGEG